MAIIGLVNTSGGAVVEYDAIARNYLEVASENYTILDADGYNYIYVTTGASDRTITLPTVADNNKRIITIKKVDSGAGGVIVDGEGSETIDGHLTITLSKEHDAVTLQAVNGKWYESVTNGKCFAEMYQTANATATTVTTQDTWYEIDNYSAGELANATITTSDITLGVGVGGYYKVSASISGVPQTPNDVFKFAFSVGDTISAKTTTSRKFASSTDAGVVSLNGILLLADGDVIKVELFNVGGTGDFTVQNSNVTIGKIA